MKVIQKSPKLAKLLESKRVVNDPTTEKLLFSDKKANSPSEALYVRNNIFNEFSRNKREFTCGRNDDFPDERKSFYEQVTLAGDIAHELGPLKCLITSIHEFLQQSPSDLHSWEGIRLVADRSMTVLDNIERNFMVLCHNMVLDEIEQKKLGL